MRRARAARLGRVAWRTLGGTARRSSSARIFCRQSWRFLYWLRDSREVTVMPVARCIMRTAESVVFTHCPPGPEAWKACASQPAASSSSGSRARRA